MFVLVYLYKLSEQVEHINGLLCSCIFFYSNPFRFNYFITPPLQVILLQLNERLNLDIILLEWSP